MADVMAERVSWLWPNRIASGKLTLIVGDPGVGKSFLTLDLAARVSAGGAWPDGSGGVEQGGVVLLGAEDDLADTIRPRLDAAGANAAKIVALQSVAARDASSGTMRQRSIDLCRDIAELEKAIDMVAPCRLVVIDPISAYLGEADSHKNAAVRAALAPLSEMAARRNVAIVAVTHLRKGDGSAKHRTIGSIAFVAAARAAWLVCEDQRDPGRRLFLPIKNNIGRDRVGLAYRLSEVDGNGVPHLEWQMGAEHISADDAIGDRQGKVDPERQRRGQKAVEFIRETLAAGPVASTEMQRLADVAGHAWVTVKRAKDRAGVTTYAVTDGDGRKRWYWSLGTQAEAKEISGHHNEIVDTLDTLDTLDLLDPLTRENQEYQGDQEAQEYQENQTRHDEPLSGPIADCHTKSPAA